MFSFTPKRVRTDLQEKIKKTGTFSGREFKARTSPDGPLPNPTMPGNVVVAPGDYQKSQRISLN